MGSLQKYVIDKVFLCIKASTFADDYQDLSLIEAEESSINSQIKQNRKRIRLQTLNVSKEMF